MNIRYIPLSASLTSISTSILSIVATEVATLSVFFGVTSPATLAIVISYLVLASLLCIFNIVKSYPDLRATPLSVSFLTMLPVCVLIHLFLVSTQLPYTVCLLVPTSILYLASYLVDHYCKDDGNHIPIGTALRVGIFFTLGWFASLLYGDLVGWIFVASVVLACLNQEYLRLKCSIVKMYCQSAEGAEESDSFHLKYYHLALGLLAILDITLLIQNPISYLRQIITHLEEVITRNEYQPNLYAQTPARELVVNPPEEYSWSIFTNDAVSTPSSPQVKAQHKNHMTSIT